MDDKYEAILKDLRNADTISVWVTKNEESVWRPLVLQIDCDQQTLLPLSHLHLENNLTAGLMLIIGVCFLSVYILVLFRDKRISTLAENRG